MEKACYTIQAFTVFFKNFDNFNLFRKKISFSLDKIDCQKRDSIINHKSALYFKMNVLEETPMTQKKQKSIELSHKVSEMLNKKFERNKDLDLLANLILSQSYNFGHDKKALLEAFKANKINEFRQKNEKSKKKIEINNKVLAHLDEKKMSSTDLSSKEFSNVKSFKTLKENILGKSVRPKDLSLINLTSISSNLLDSNYQFKMMKYENNYTSEEYGYWLKTKSLRISDKISSNFNRIKADLGEAYSQRVVNFQASKPNNNVKLDDAFSESLDTDSELPEPAIKLTNGRRISEIDEIKTQFKILNYSKSDLIETKEPIKSGYLNLNFHYLSYESDLELSREKFYSVVRLDQVPKARSCLIKPKESEQIKPLKKIEFNEQFILELSDKSYMDIVLCQCIENLADSSNIVKKKKDLSHNRCSILKYSSKKMYLFDLVNSLKEPAKNYFKIELKSDKSLETFFMFVSFSYFREYSLINQIFSSRQNSKIFSLPLDSTKNSFETIFKNCIHEIESRGLDENHIYEYSTCLTDIKWAILQLERDFFSIIQQIPDINAISSRN